MDDKIMQQLLNSMHDINSEIKGLRSEMQSEISMLGARVGNIEEKVCNIDKRLISIAEDTINTRCSTENIDITIEKLTNPYIENLAESHIDLESGIDFLKLRIDQLSRDLRTHDLVNKVNFDALISLRK